MTRPPQAITRAARAAVVGLVLLGVTACGQGGNVSEVDVSGVASASPTASSVDGEQTVVVDGVPDVVGTVATGLETPWGVAFLPDGRGIVTERDSARVLLVTPPPVVDGKADGKGEVVEIGRVPETDPRGEAGLLGVAVSPTFATDGLVYFYVCTDEDNRVVRARLGDDGLGQTEPILTGIPAGTIHDGGRIAFGPDGHLYVTTGETGDIRLSQDEESLGGKILRITADGYPAPDNPLGTEVWSWGHRNVQGIAWDTDNQLWATEFGERETDELNRILPGENYGWPEVEGEGGEPEFTDPVLTWTTDEASPSGLAHTPGHLWMAALNGERLWRIAVANGQATEPTAFFANEYGRIRTVAVAPDGRLWMTTSNRDGRGDAAEDDDRILLVEP